MVDTGSRDSPDTSEPIRGLTLFKAIMLTMISVAKQPEHVHSADLQTLPHFQENPSLPVMSVRSICHPCWVSKTCSPIMIKLILMHKY